jgi:hypothetical protein
MKCSSLGKGALRMSRPNPALQGTLRDESRAAPLNVASENMSGTSAIIGSSTGIGRALAEAYRKNGTACSTFTRNPESFEGFFLFFLKRGGGGTPASQSEATTTALPSITAMG